MRINSLIILFSFLTVYCTAQDIKQYDNVYAKGGSFFRGHIVDTVENNMRIRLAKSGALVSIDLAAVKSVKKEKQGLQQFKNGLRAQATGRYSTFSIHSLSAQALDSYWNENRGGIGLQASYGRYLKPWFSVGAGIGLDVYSELIVPVYGELKCFVPGMSEAPYLSLQVGHGFAIQRMFDSNEVDNSRGGFMWYPAIGMRFATRRSSEIHLDLGYKFQSYTIEQGESCDWWSCFLAVKEEIRFQSLALRFSYLF